MVAPGLAAFLSRGHYGISRLSFALASSLLRPHETRPTWNSISTAFQRVEGAARPQKRYAL